MEVGLDPGGYSNLRHSCNSNASIRNITQDHSLLSMAIIQKLHRVNLQQPLKVLTMDLVLLVIVLVSDARLDDI